MTRISFLSLLVSPLMLVGFTLAFSPTPSAILLQPSHHKTIATFQQSPFSSRSSNTLRNTKLFQGTNNNNDNHKDDNILDVLICGAGPAGLLLAQELSKRNMKVAVVDPALDKAWPNNYGVWMDEADYYGYADCCDRVWNEVGIVFDESAPELVLTRPYGRVDRKTMKARLIRECQAHNVQFHVAKATNVQHYDNQPSVVTTKSFDKNNNKSTTTTNEFKALLVADATGFAREFVQHDVEFDPGFQVTYGARFRVKDIGNYQVDRMVLMDYSEQHLYSNPELTQSNIRFPSFCYIMPLAQDEIFLEETVLVSRPGASSRDLQARLELRMQALGIEPLEVLEDERAAIPMGGMDPVVPQRTLGFGATASLVHPASGYMVARAMEIAPRVAEAVASQIQDLGMGQQQQSQEAANIIIQPGQLDKIAKAGWDAVWPTDERRQRDFMHFGFELLCRLNPQELRDFFTGFFRLPNGLWEHFLSWRLSGLGHVVMGITVWATCIPKRFMPSMLINSIPFIGNRLVGPFASRGNFAMVDTDSVYADARTGNPKVWEPDAYYPYLQKISKMKFGATAADKKSDNADANINAATAATEFVASMEDPKLADSAETTKELA